MNRVVGQQREAVRLLRAVPEEEDEAPLGVGTLEVAAASAASLALPGQRRRATRSMRNLKRSCVPLRR